MSVVFDRSFFRLMVVTDGTGRADLPALVEATLRGGALMIQLREKSLSPEGLLDVGRRIKDATARWGARLIINHDAQAARQLDADGVHLGWRSIAVAEARSLLGPHKIIGRSTHSLDDVERARDEGADYVVFGPIYETPSKQGLVEAQGVERLERAVRLAGAMPVLAIGGIGYENLAAVWDARPAGVAVIRSVIGAPNPAKAVWSLLEVINSLETTYRREAGQKSAL